MEEGSYLGELLAGLFYGIAGYRMLRLASRTREIPERILGLTFLLMAVSFLLYQLPLLFHAEHLELPLYFSARVVYGASALAIALFTRIVFRPDDLWSLVLVLGVACGLVAGIGLSALGGDLEGFSISNVWFWFEWVANTLPFAWIVVEALIQYRSGRRRVRIGLLEPIVCNRFCLWMIAGLIQVIAFLVTLMQYAEYEVTGVWSTWSDSTLGVLELATIAAIWLVFFPPTAYRRWVASGEPRPESGSNR